MGSGAGPKILHRGALELQRGPGSGLDAGPPSVQPGKGLRDFGPGSCLQLPPAEAIAHAASIAVIESFAGQGWLLVLHI